MERLTVKEWRNLDPWECCGQDSYCKRGCHDEGGCTNGCIVPKLYVRLAQHEDDLELEEMWNELEDVLFVEDEDGHLVLNSDWRDFDKGTPQEEIWSWFGSRHSKGLDGLR